jgi:hypothetical protein
LVSHGAAGGLTSPTWDWCTEAFDTADLQEVKTLPDTLR